MPTWKLNIFVRAIRTRIINEEKTVQEILSEYTALTENEISEILNNIIK